MDVFRFDPPDLTEHEVRMIVRELYDLEGDIQPLRGERSHNTRITSAGGEFVLRVASAGEPDAMIEFHAAALRHIADRAGHLPVAKMIPAADGSWVPSIVRHGVRHRVRLETFLPGVTFDERQIVPAPALTEIGALLGRVARALADFDHPAAHGFMPWDIANGLTGDDALRAGLRPDAVILVTRARSRLAAAGEAMRSLPRQVVHNDGHAGNVLRSGPDAVSPTGLIDFGDLVHTVTVADLAVCGASFAPHQPDPAAALAAIVAGYHSEHPLSVDERAAVPDLVMARLVLSALMIEYQIDNAPHIAEAVAAERAGTLTGLERWLGTDPSNAIRLIMEAT
jgi:Ser/Thr protein kinase RdoA (MazF antagonist)